MSDLFEGEKKAVCTAEPSAEDVHIPTLGICHVDVRYLYRLSELAAQKDLSLETYLECLHIELGFEERLRTSLLGMFRSAGYLAPGVREKLGSNEEWEKSTCLDVFPNENLLNLILENNAGESSLPLTSYPSPSKGSGYVPVVEKRPDPNLVNNKISRRSSGIVWGGIAELQKTGSREALRNAVQMREEEASPRAVAGPLSGRFVRAAQPKVRGNKELIVAPKAAKVSHEPAARQDVQNLAPLLEGLLKKWKAMKGKLTSACEAL